MQPVLIVLAAGLGSRYGGVKQIDGVGRHNETLLEYASYDAHKAGYNRLVYVIRKDIEAGFRERFFDRVAKNCDASYVFQSPERFLTPRQIKRAKGRTKPWGTIHALLCAKDAVQGPFTVINADDYYGRAAFITMGSYLANLSHDSTEHAMVGYVLGKTLSASGTVSRGICGVKNGSLVSIQEHKAIGCAADGAIVSTIGQETVTLTGLEPVSMNFFGFAAGAFDYFTGFFARFIEEHAEDEKAECFLPEGAGAIVREGKGSIKVFSSEETWFGITYPEDRALVRDEIEKKISGGYYPHPLWENE